MKTPVTETLPAAPAVERSRGMIPLIERIRELVRMHPDWGAWKLKGELNRRRDNHPKVGWGEVRAELKYSGLRTKAERFRFARGG